MKPFLFQNRKFHTSTLYCNQLLCKAYTNVHNNICRSTILLESIFTHTHIQTYNYNNTHVGPDQWQWTGIWAYKQATPIKIWPYFIQISLTYIWKISNVKQDFHWFRFIMLKSLQCQTLITANFCIMNYCSFLEVNFYCTNHCAYYTVQSMGTDTQNILRNIISF